MSSLLSSPEANPRLSKSPFRLAVTQLLPAEGPIQSSDRRIHYRLQHGCSITGIQWSSQQLDFFFTLASRLQQTCTTASTRRTNTDVVNNVPLGGTKRFGLSQQSGVSMTSLRCVSSREKKYSIKQAYSASQTCYVSAFRNVAFLPPGPALSLPRMPAQHRGLRQHGN